MLAERLPSIMSPLSDDKALERASIYSVANKRLDLTQLKVRPFRSPHHSSSAVALVGGGSIPKPGEISLAHEGVLFLDELPEFPRSVLEVLRQPLENGVIHLSRAAQQTTFPANFQLIGAMNPCPCGGEFDS
ncbi:AAA+ ATPase superfamily protein YifB/ComM, associated with DNA recombination [uncultured Gammaproteobacteria bacterium]|nr:AAA+ ATPase superfamily protein YifB/ComM, associated with DNA recombination [uncultured Gammaproteobacteria bacterium]CAC9994399.1 AAA+ ATPase superfamily protein YifB/ComM, associated with DNA recombination [uncultured Gammaproteobacteria bacterium]